MRGIREFGTGSCLLAIGLLALGFPAKAEGGYTNHAGNVVAGWPVALTATQVSLSEEGRGKSLEGGGKSEETSSLPAQTSSLQPPRSSLYPLSIFPESEQRRVCRSP